MAISDKAFNKNTRSPCGSYLPKKSTKKRSVGFSSVLFVVVIAFRGVSRQVDFQNTKTKVHAENFLQKK
jgi:hypothetical protein